MSLERRQSIAAIEAAITELYALRSITDNHLYHSYSAAGLQERLDEIDRIIVQLMSLQDRVLTETEEVI